MVDVNTAAEPVAGYVLVHRKVLNKLGISDSVVDTIAAQSASEQHEFNDESPFCVKCGSTGEDSVQPVAHILPRMLKILKFKSMPVPVDPLPYDNGEEKTVPLYTTPPATQAEPVIPAGFALVPIRATAAMVEAFSEEGWEWANVLAAAEAVTEGEYEAALEGTPPATQADNWNEVEAYQAALTAALGALKRLAKRDGWKPFVTEDANDQWKPAEQDGLDAIAQLEALGE